MPNSSKEPPRTVDAEPKPGISFAENTKQGAMAHSVYAERQVKYIPIAESELVTLNSHNSEVTIWSSFGSILVALVFACAWDMLTSGKAEDFNWVAAWFFFGVCILGGVLSFGKAIHNYRAKQRHLNLIRKETTD